MSWCWLQFCVCFCCLCCCCCCSLVLYSNPGVQLLSFVRSSEGISRFKRSQAKAFIKPTEIKCLLSFCVCVSEVNPTNHPSKKQKSSPFTHIQKKRKFGKRIRFLLKTKNSKQFPVNTFFCEKKIFKIFFKW